MSPARSPDGLERRVEVACDCWTITPAPGVRKMTGHAALFNSPAKLGDFTEIVRPGAFTESLASGRDILALVDHDPSRLLARTKSGTLKLVEDKTGLLFEIDPPDTQLGRDMCALAHRRDLGGASFGFRVLEDYWPSPNMRELRKVELYEISIIQAFPAYPETTVQARSRTLTSGARKRRRFLETLR